MRKAVAMMLHFDTLIGTNEAQLSLLVETHLHTHILNGTDPDELTEAARASQVREADRIWEDPSDPLSFRNFPIEDSNLLSQLARNARGSTLALAAASAGWATDVVVPGFRLPFLNELFAPRRCHMAGASTFGAGLATERQAARNIAFALTDWALCQRWL